MGIEVLAWWLGTRLILLSLIPGFVILNSDIEYYFAWARIGNLTGGLEEYPFPMALGLMLPGKILTSVGAYKVGYIASALAVDGLITWLMGRRFGLKAAAHWVWLVAAFGSLAYTRFDIYVAAALAGVLIFATGAPVKAGLAVALGSAVKMWPAVFGFGLVGEWRQRRRHMVAAIIGGLTWVLATAVSAGFDRVFSPLKWQGARGFQVESVLGSVMGLAKLGGARLELELRQGSWEYVGAQARQWDFVVKPLSYLGYLAIVALVVLAWRAGRDGRVQTLAVSMLAIISTFMVASPVISPQYLIWIAPALAVIEERRMRWLGYVIMVLTQLNVPFFFDWFFRGDAPYSQLIRIDVFVRNVLLIWLTIWAVKRLVQLARDPQSRVSSSQTSPSTRD